MKKSETGVYDGKSEFEATKLKDQKYVMQNYGRQPIQIVKGKGSILTDSEGKNYIDCVSGIAVNSIGYGDKRFVDAITKQASELIHISNLYYNKPQANLAEKLCEISGMSRVFFCNSGAEAMEAAIKLARLKTGKSKFIAAKHSFHGRTVGSLGLTYGEKYRIPFEPLVQSAEFVEFGDSEAVSDAISKDTAAVVLEPIQGEGGVHVPNDNYLQEVRKICDENGILLIFDEVQTGFGRTGKWFCKDNFNVQPDIMTMAKAIAGGLPMGAIAAREGLSFGAGEHASTFGGSPLVSAAALASIKIIEEDNLISNSFEMGKYLKEKLSSMKRKDVVSVRGKGLLVGVELDHPCGYIVNEARESGVLLNVTSGNVVRFIPPLTISKEEIDKVVDVLDNIPSQKT
ncbi:MAG: acetylornithine transaminase [Methanosarcinaceae archaeon]|nr:acetylornithine transaminase [Methanosarcinaceae archaeon]